MTTQVKKHKKTNTEITAYWELRKTIRSETLKEKEAKQGIMSYTKQWCNYVCSPIDLFVFLQNLLKLEHKSPPDKGLVGFSCSLSGLVREYSLWLDLFFKANGLHCSG